MENSQIQKRTGETVSFDAERILIAINKAIQATENHGIVDSNFSQNITNEITKELEKNFFALEKIPTVENIQDIVEEKLVESGNFIIAKTYIIYREEHNKQRSQKRLKELENIDKNLIRVIKNDGRKEPFSRIKLEKFWSRVAFDYETVCPFKTVFEVFKLTLTDNIKTAQILKNLRKTALELTSIENTAWQLMAGRLYAFEFHKEAMRNRQINYTEIYTSKSWKKHFDDYIEKKLYSAKLRETYSDAEILEAGDWINKEQDFEYIYSTYSALTKRYLLNPNKIIRELPQEMYLAIALFLAIPEKQTERLKIARAIYEATSSQKLSLATPTLLNARTNFHQLSSCFKLNVNDDLRSIYHNIENIAQISKFGGGVGVYLGRLRSRGASIRGVKGVSGGIVPWSRVINDTACAVNQLGSRRGAVSITLDVWHRDIHDFLNLQTESGDIRSKAFDIFPAISVPDLFMERVEKDENWTLFDPYEVYQATQKRLEDYFDQDFRAFYLECENNPKLELREVVKAKDLMKKILKTTVETGMPYFFFRDTVNRLNPNQHIGHIYSTQLCTEICQNTSESKFQTESFEDGTVQIKYQPGDTVVCNLASINIAKVNQDAEIEKIIKIATCVLDNVITLNFYPIKEAELTALKYRSVGLGFMGLAEYLACNQLSYDSQEARERVDQLFEKYTFSVLKNSCELARERGAYSVFSGSEWQKGFIMGHNKDWFLKNSKTNLNWSELIENIQNYGLRFAYHLAPAPNTSTAGLVGTTAGLLPIYKKFFMETNAFSTTITVAPNLNEKNFWYYKEYLHMEMNDIIDMIAIIYKWIDQSISFEWMMDPSCTSPTDLYNWYLYAWKNKIKTVYYLRSLSGEVNEGCVSCSG